MPDCSVSSLAKIISSRGRHRCRLACFHVGRAAAARSLLHRALAKRVDPRHYRLDPHSLAGHTERDQRTVALGRETMGQGDRQQQSGIGYLAVGIEGDLDAVRLLRW